MTIDLGTTLRCDLPPRHLWIVLSNPTHTNGDVLLVNLTSLTDDCVDDKCLLGPADFSLLTHDTTAAYSRSRVGTVAKLDGLIQQGVFVPVTTIPAAALKKILQGAQASQELSTDKKRLVG